MVQKYFRNLYLICSIVGIIPFFSFRKCKLVKKVMNKIWLLILLIYKLLLITGYFILSFPLFENEYSLTTMKILEHPTNFSFWLMPFSTVFLLLLSNNKKWEIFLKKFIKINSLLPSKTNNRYYVKHILNLLLNLIIIFYIYSDKYILESTNYTIIFRAWFLMYVTLEEVFWLYMIIFTTEIVLNLKERYEVLNQRFVQILHVSIENKFMTKDVDVATIKDINKIKFLYRYVNDLVESVSNLFGWSTFCLMAYTILDALTVLNCMIVGDFTQPTERFELFVLIVST